jgi:hypothetical protein
MCTDLPCADRSPASGTISSSGLRPRRADEGFVARGEAVVHGTTVALFERRLPADTVRDGHP